MSHSRGDRKSLLRAIRLQISFFIDGNKKQGSPQVAKVPLQARVECATHCVSDKRTLQMHDANLEKLMSYPSPAHALSAIAQEIGASGLSFDESGIARIGINDEIVVAFAQGVRENCLDIVAEIPVALEELTHEMAVNLLLANFRAGGLGLPTFSVNPTDGKVLMSNSLQVNRLSLEDMMEAFRSFTGVLYHYHGPGLKDLREHSKPADSTIN